MSPNAGLSFLSAPNVPCSVYARAFQEGFTITLVSGRTVGIGAYLARLGRRSVVIAEQCHLVSQVAC